MSWECLPEVIVGNIFSYLGLLDKLKVKYVCQNWKKAESRPVIWHSFIFSEDVQNNLEKSNGVTSYLNEYSPTKTEILESIHEYGRHFKYVVIYLKGEASMEIFLKVSVSCSNIHHIQLVKWWNCDMKQNVQKSLYTLLHNNKNLNAIALKDMNIKSDSRNDPLPIGLRHSQRLQRLALVNSFGSHSLSSLMYLVNVTELTINPQHLSYSLISHLSSASLVRLNIVANTRTRLYHFENLSEQQWGDISKNQDLRVYIYISLLDDWSMREALLKANIPLVTLAYRKNMWSKLNHLANLLPYYSNTLEEFVDYSIKDRFYEFSSSDYRHEIVQIVKACPQLHTLAFKQKLSSSVILVLAILNPNLSKLFIRDDMVTYDFSLDEETEAFLGPEMLDFIRLHWNEGNFIHGMCILLGKNWHLMSNTEYLDTLEGSYSSFM